MNLLVHPFDSTVSRHTLIVLVGRGFESMSWADFKKYNKINYLYRYFGGPGGTSSIQQKQSVSRRLAQPYPSYVSYSVANLVARTPNETPGLSDLRLQHQIPIS